MTKRKDPKDFLKLGRPTLYREKYCKALLEHMSKGLSYESFAGTIGVSRDILYDWEKAQPPFRHAKQIGKEMSMLFWEELGVDQAVNGGGSVGTWVFNMKNRFDWTDKRETVTRVELEAFFRSRKDEELIEAIEAKGIVLSEIDADED